MNRIIILVMVVGLLARVGAVVIEFAAFTVQDSINLNLADFAVCGGVGRVMNLAGTVSTPETNVPEAPEFCASLIHYQGNLHPLPLQVQFKTELNPPGKSLKIHQNNVILPVNKTC